MIKMKISKKRLAEGKNKKKEVLSEDFGTLTLVGLGGAALYALYKLTFNSKPSAEMALNDVRRAIEKRMAQADAAEEMGRENRPMRTGDKEISTPEKQLAQLKADRDVTLVPAV